jgi:hypothetical protein
MMTLIGSSSARAPWFDPAITAVLDQAHVVLEAQHTRALERLTSQLIGAQLHLVLVAEKTGLWFDPWFIELVSATESRVREQADGGAWEAPFRLLHGLAAIGTPGAAQTALGRDAVSADLRELAGRVKTANTQPVPRFTPSWSSLSSRASGSSIDRVDGRSHSGRMFLLWWKALSGSYLALTSASRRYV